MYGGLAELLGGTGLGPFNLVAITLVGNTQKLCDSTFLHRRFFVLWPFTIVPDLFPPDMPYFKFHFGVSYVSDVVIVKMTRIFFFGARIL